MSRLLENLQPRSFVNATLPFRDDGNVLKNCVQDGDFETYVAWLADYLHTIDLPLTIDQRDWLEAEPRSAKEVVFEC